MQKIINRFGGVIRLFPDSAIFGKSFRTSRSTLLAFYEAPNKQDFVEHYQKRQLERIINHAKKYSVYYKRTLNSNFIEDLPFIDKECIVDNFDGILITKQNADYVTTGGTSGKPLGFYIDKDRKGSEWFWMTNNWRHVGYDISTSYRATLRNYKVKGRYIRNRFLKEYIFNNFALCNKYIEYIINFIKQNNIQFIHAYPSAAYQIGAFAVKNNIDIPCLKAFLCGSENIQPIHKKVIEQQLHKRMYTWYGHSEKLILAGEQTDCQNYHANPFYGFCELIDTNGSRITRPGEVGELVGTGFINTKMPFIRYRTGDFAEYVGENCPQCGQTGLTFKNVIGRWSGERIFKKDGSAITTTALNMHSSIYENISNFQYYQDTQGILEIHLVPFSSFSEYHKKEIYKAIRRKAGDQLDIVIKEVSDIEYTKNHKYKLLIQRIRQ